MAGLRRYAIVGTGGRHVMYRNSLLNLYANNSELVALSDINTGRLRLSLEKIRQHGGIELPGYHSSDFERMIDECRPETVIVTTMDSTHHDYICRAMEAGCDVITEKPLTTRAENLQRIVDTVAATGRQVTVTFNYRYAPPRVQVKRLLDDGEIGDILSVDFHWMLDTRHGADYFRRWHRRKANSGGLLVHKATHHFDLVNWWISSVPDSVFADGGLRYYQPRTAAILGLDAPAERCQGCPEAPRCPFFLDLEASRGLRELYLEQEEYDGYQRDQCVFSPEIDIEDNMSVEVRYRSGALLTYSLIACSPWEGYRIAFNGTRGRLEHDMIEGSHIIGDGSTPGVTVGSRIRVMPHFRAPYDVPIESSDGGHGGADPLLLEQLFAEEAKAEDPLKRRADYRAGGWSALVGFCANRSMTSGVPVRTEDLIRDLPLPDGVI